MRRAGTGARDLSGAGTGGATRHFSQRWFVQVSQSHFLYFEFLKLFHIFSSQREGARIPSHPNYR
jgi:hypothetical protein